MQGVRPARGGLQWTIFIYMDGLTGVLTRNRKLVAMDNLTMGSINSQEKEVQSSLDQFYSNLEYDDSDLESIHLIFINSIFHLNGKGQIETYKNRLPAYLFYHKEFFSVPVNHEHLAQRLNLRLNDWHENTSIPVLWYHLRRNLLFVAFCTSSGDVSITSFEVQKVIDVYYYILFNYQTLLPAIPHLQQIVISGELVNLDKIHNFFEENMPNINLVTYWQWQELPGRSHIPLNTYLPEVNIY